MFEIGATLREARAKRGLTIEDVQKRLRLRARYLTALEEERWDLLPGEAYAKGFLRMYADFLGLEGRLFIEQYKARIARHEDEPLVPESLAGTGKSRLLFRTVVGLLAVGGAVALAGALGVGSSKGTQVQAPDLSAVASAAIAKPAVHALRARPGARPTLEPKPVLASIRAVKARCWLSIRVGGRTGKEVFRGVLLPGHALRYRLGPAVWLRMGRPQALAVRIGPNVIGGLPHDPANLLLTKRGPEAG
jgi:cytoskeleton protein RodZ